MVKLAEQLVPVKIDGEKERTLVRKFRVRGYPAIFFVSAQGKTVGKIGGYMPPEGFAAELQRIIRVNRELPALKAKYEADPDDVETAMMLIGVYAANGETARCLKITKAIEKRDPENEKGHLSTAYSALADSYVENDKFRSAVKYYEKVAGLVQEPGAVADARIGAAYAQFMDRTRFDPGSRPAANRVKKAEEQLTALLEVADLPEDRKEQAKQLLAQVRGSQQQ